MKKNNPWKRFLRTLVRDRQLTAGERMASRIGYMGAGFLMAGQWTVEPILLYRVCVYIKYSVETMELSCITTERTNSMDSTFY